MMVRMASRDASCYNRPNVTSTKVLHVVVGPGMAACNGTLLCDFTETDVQNVPERLRCRRAACMNRWKKSP